MIATKNTVADPPATDPADLGLPSHTNPDTLLADYLEGQLTFNDLANAHDISIPDLLAWADHPRTRRTIDALEREAARRADTILALAAPQAARRLATIAAHDPADHQLVSPALDQRCRETSRNAANALLKHAGTGPTGLTRCDENANPHQSVGAARHAGRHQPATNRSPQGKPRVSDPSPEPATDPEPNANRNGWSAPARPVDCTRSHSTPAAEQTGHAQPTGVEGMKFGSTIALAATAAIAGVAVADDVEGPFIPGQVIVRFAEQPTPQAMALVEAALGADAAWQSPRHAQHAKGEPDAPHPLSFYRLLKTDPEADVQALSTAIAATPGVLWASPNGAPEPTYEPDDPLFGAQWNHQKINSEAGWDVSLGTTDIVMGVVDTGCLISHEDLAAHVWFNDDPPNGIDDDGNGFVDDTNGWNFVNNNNNIADVYGHGTEVSGITSARIDNDTGVAGLGNTSILTAKWWHTGGSDFSVAESVFYAVDNGAHVVNMSLSCGCLMPMTEDAVNYAHENNVVPVAASGNASTGNPHYPAAYPTVIAVSGIDMNDNKYSFGNWGSHIDVTAPTPEITTTSSAGPTSYTNGFGGTSAASPHVAGLVGLMLSVDDSLTVEEVRALLHENAEDVGDPGFDVIYGHGRIDVGATMEAVAAGSCPADFNKDGSLDVLDFVAFQDAWAAQDPAADCNDDADFSVLDFVCFQSLFQAGCN